MRALRDLLVLAVASTFVISHTNVGVAQQATIVRATAKQVFEFLAGQAEKQGSKVLAKELADFGGEAAFREIFEQVMKDSGEAGVSSLARLTKSYGIDAMQAARVAPRMTTRFAEGLAPELAPSALRALARPADRLALESVGDELVPGALEAAARHPGVGAQLVKQIGPAGVRASRQFDTDAVIQLVRSSEAASFGALAKEEQKGLSEKIVQFMVDNPKTVLTASVLALFLDHKTELVGGKGGIVLGPDGKPTYVPEPGLIERLIHYFADRVLIWILPPIAALIGLWGAIQIRWAWKRLKLSYALKASELVQHDNPIEQGPRS